MIQVDLLKLLQVVACILQRIATYGICHIDNVKNMKRLAVTFLPGQMLYEATIVRA